MRLCFRYSGISVFIELTVSRENTNNKCIDTNIKLQIWKSAKKVKEQDLGWEKMVRKTLFLYIAINV